MPARIFTIAQQKGGTGKTSLTAHLAAAWAGQGKRVAAIDIDPQGSLSAWAEIRAKDKSLPAITVAAISGWRSGAEVDRLAKQHDVVLIDCPPHGETGPKFAIRAADLIVVPMQPSPLDVWATRETIRIIQAEKRRPILVFNRVPPRGALADGIRAAVGNSGAPIAAATLGNRQAFGAAIARGRGITEHDTRGRAAAELSALADELYGTSLR